MEVSVFLWANPSQIKKNIDLTTALENCYKYDLEKYPTSLTMQLLEEIRIKENKKHIGEFLLDKLHNQLTLKCKFAKKLNLFDIVSANCFKSKDKMSGYAYLDFLSETEFKFLLFMKNYIDIKKVELQFIVLTESDYIGDYLMIINGKIDKVYG